MAVVTNSGAITLPRAAAAGCPEDLLEASWAARGRPIERRELGVEALATAAFGLALVLLGALAPGEPRVDAATAALVVAYALATRIDFPIGLASTVPTQLFLVPLFFAAPAELVPLLVAAGLALGNLIGVLSGQARLDRLACVGGDALHSVGPAVVLVLLAGGAASAAAPWVLALALASQFALDLLSGMVREHLISGVAPRVQILAQAQIWAGDAALAPVGYLAATAAGGAGAALVLLPLAGLLAYAARDRRARIATAHQRLEALHAERQRLRRAVRRIGDAFASNLEVDAILDVVVRTVSDALQAEGARVRARDESAPEADDVVARALGAAEEEALRAGHLKAADAGGVHSMACPLHSLGAVLSVARRGEPYDYDERSLFAHLCGQADVAGSNAIRHLFVQKQALTDDLTSLANHRSFHEVLEGVVERRGERDRGLALMLVDLDDFKLVNDVHGHLAGDDVLREVGRCLRENCRITDQPARYGGEEFAVVLEGCRPAQALALAERLRAAIAGISVLTAAGERLSVTASIGVARMSREAVSRHELIAAADAALYEAKTLGKNRVAWVDLDDSRPADGPLAAHASPAP